MNEHDSLQALLRRWRDIEPPGNFEANVWRRIRLVESPPAQPAWLGWGAWLRQPALTLGMAVGILVGVLGGWHSTRPAAPLQFLGRDTLAGAYLRGGGR